MTSLRAKNDSAARDVPRVGVYEAVASTVLPPLLRALGGSPLATAEAHEERELVRGVAEGTIDLTFATLPLPPGPFTWAELLDEQYVLLVPANHPLAERPQPPGLAEVAALPLIAREGRRFGEQVTIELTSSGQLPHFVQRLRSDAAARALVAAGLGCAILPRLSVHPLDGTVAIDLAGVFPPSKLVFAWHRDRRLPAQCERVLDAVVATCAELAAQQRSLEWLINWAARRC